MGLVLIPKRYAADPSAWAEVTNKARELSPSLFAVGYELWSEVEATGTPQWVVPALLPTPNANESVVLDLPTPVGYDAELDLPPDLAATRIDDPTIAPRYLALIESAIATAPPNTRYLTFHAEGVREYFETRPDEVEAYCVLLEQAMNRARELEPSLRIGTYWRYENEPDELFDCVNRATDHVAIALILNPPEDRPDDARVVVERYLERAGDKPLAIVEAGYPSSPDAFGSEADQAAFYESLFGVVDEHAAQVRFVSVYSVFDESREINEWLADQIFGDGQESTKALFVGWITSLGLVTEDDRPKLAWDVVRARSLR
jgi:hypothetical protein